MRERPILFSTPIVQAILAGEKTQTRRIIKEDLSVIRESEIDVFKDFLIHGRCPYGVPGDQLWVRETFQVIEKPFRDPGSYAIIAYDDPEYIYKADKLPHIADIMKWKPSIFMPREASRITLEIEEVRVERVQDISYPDAKAEGCGDPQGFYDIWCKINGEQLWLDNPWVWVVKFVEYKGGL